MHRPVAPAGARVSASLPWVPLRSTSGNNPLPHSGQKIKKEIVDVGPAIATNIAGKFVYSAPVGPRGLGPTFHSTVTLGPVHAFDFNNLST